MSSRQKGMTLVEVLMGIAILAVLIFASVSLTTSALQSTRMNMARQFATQKAISILEELKSVAQNAVGGNVVVLDQYDDGVNYVDTLTEQGCPSTCVGPNAPASGNIMGPSGWLYQRQVSVTRIGSQNAGVRLVRVSVFRHDLSGEHLLAEVTSVVRTLSNTMPQTQVYDVYAIAIENVPGWWVYTSTLVPFVQNAISDLETRNPGLQFHVHWIRKLSYGRDQEYTPFINSLTDPVNHPTNWDSTKDINYVYFYPGALPLNNATLNPPNLTDYYPFNIFAAHFKTETSPTDPTPIDENGYDATNNPVPYALADQYNNSMRYYDEQATFNARYAAGLDTEPTYRLLLDNMMMYPASYTNAILINLHGELFPFPPIRNYSDPAKAPDTVATAPNNLQNIRVVTHPEFLAYGSTTPNPALYPASENCHGLTAGQQCINLRVYSYEAPSGSSSYAGTGYLNVPITVMIPGVDLTPNGTLAVTRIEGGTTQTPGTPYAASNAVVAPSGSRMYATVSVVMNGTVPNTLIKLYNSPITAPQCTVGLCGATAGSPLYTSRYEGLPAADYLYNQQYIPAPMENFAQTAVQTPFAQDLTSNTNAPKNTARWIISINVPNLENILNSNGFPGYSGIPTCSAPCPNTALAIETRIGDVPAGSLPTTGSEWPVRNQPPNLSRTYTWLGTDLWLYGDGTDTNPPHLPMTERFQFQGDPRHCPYADDKMVHTNAGTTWSPANVNTRFGMGYNRYFDDFQTSTVNAVGTWPGWTYTVGSVQYGVKNSSTAFAPNTQPGFDDGWTPTTGSPSPPYWGQIEIDIPRAFQILRSALTGSRAIYTTMTGFSYYYVGIGDEMGYDSANQFPKSIPVSTMPFNNTSGTTTEQSITNDINWGDQCNGGPAQGCGVKYIRSSGAINPGFPSYWWAMTWLGELYPDGDYLGANGYAANGNLSTNPSNPPYFKRVLRGTINPPSGFTLPSGTLFNGGLYSCAGGDSTKACFSGYNAVRRTFANGSTSLFWSGTSSSTFHHQTPNGNGSLTNEGLNIASATSGYNYPILNPIPANRPFDISLNQTGDDPEYQSSSPYTAGFLNSVYGPTFVTTKQALYYQQTPANIPASALVSLRDPTTNKTAFIAVNGLSPTGAAGANFIAHWSFLSLIYSFFQGGLYPVSGTETGCSGCTFRVPQLPRVTITYPNLSSNLNNPPSINIQWNIGWTRWDGNPYTPAYSSTFAETTPLQYQVMYSPDGGTTWRWCDTSIPGTPAPGVRNPAALISATNYNWSTPASSFPMGNYLIRVEAYRQGINLHYSYHEFRAFIWGR